MKNNEKTPFIQKMTKNLHDNYFSIVVFIIICALVIFIVWNWDIASGTLSRLASVLTPFLVAVFIAYLIMPLMNTIDKILNKLLFKNKGKKVRWVISLVLAYVIVIGIITAALIFVVPQLGASIKEMDFKKMGTSAISYIQQLQEKVPYLNSPEVNAKINSMQPKLMDYGPQVVSYIIPKIFVFSKSIVSITINFLLSIVISIYFVIDKKNILRHLKRLIFAVTPKDKSKGIWNTMRECNHIFNGFLIGKTLDSFIIGVLCFIILTILQLPYAILLSVIVGITNMIPYFGPFIGAIPGVIIYLLIQPQLAVIFAIAILALQQFDGLYLGPKILGDLTGLKPLWVIFAITVGGAYFGVLGMFLGVPVVAVVSYLLNMFIEKKLKSKDIEI